MASQVEIRKEFSEAKLRELAGALSEFERIAQGKACVYATGSFGRGEASPFSDLDLFIVGKSEEVNLKNGTKEQRRALSRLDEICLKADLIKTTRNMGFPEFSQDGRYIVHYTVYDLIKSLGTPEDDAFNTFTARMLLLLESRPLVEPSVYNEVLRDVVAGYWKDFEEHSTSFVPAFLTNDILRFWRTLCVNYEVGRSAEPEFEKAKGKAKNYKLRHSRILTCYSALLYLLRVHSSNGTVTPEDAMAMIVLSPLARIESLKKMSPRGKFDKVLGELLSQYEKFLLVTNKSETDLIAEFKNRSSASSLGSSARNFGDSLFKLLNELGDGKEFHRLIVV